MQNLMLSILGKTNENFLPLKLYGCSKKVNAVLAVSWRKYRLYHTTRIYILGLVCELGEGLPVGRFSGPIGLVFPSCAGLFPLGGCVGLGLFSNFIILYIST